MGVRSWRAILVVIMIALGVSGCMAGITGWGTLTVVYEGQPVGDSITAEAGTTVTVQVLFNGVLYTGNDLTYTITVDGVPFDDAVVTIRDGVLSMQIDENLFDSVIRIVLTKPTGESTEIVIRVVGAGASAGACAAGEIDVYTTECVAREDAGVDVAASPSCAAHGDPCAGGTCVAYNLNPDDDDYNPGPDPGEDCGFLCFDVPTLFSFAPATCTEANNCVDVGGGNFVPTQALDCIAGGGGGGGGGVPTCDFYEDFDLLTVCAAGCDETPTEALAAAFDVDPGVDVIGQPIETLRELSDTCVGEDKWLRATPANFIATPNPASAVCQVMFDRFTNGGTPKDLYVRIDATGTYIDVALEDGNRVYDPTLLPNGVNKDWLGDLDNIIMGVMWAALVPNEDLMAFTPGKIKYGPVGNEANALSCGFGISRVKPNPNETNPEGLKQCKTEPDPNYDHDYQLRIGMNTPLDGSSKTVAHAIDCGDDGTNIGLNFDYEIVDADCDDLPNYSEDPHTFTNSVLGVTGCPDGIGGFTAACDETVASGRDHIYQLGTFFVPPEPPGYGTLLDYYNVCNAAGRRVKMRLFSSDEISADPDAAACRAVAGRFLVDYTAPPAEHEMKEFISYAFVGGELVFTFGPNPTTVPAPDPIFEDLSLGASVNDGFFPTDFNDSLPAFEYGLNAAGTPNMNVYDAFGGGNPVIGNLHISRVKVDSTMTAKGDGVPYHYIIIFGLESSVATGALCGAAGGFTAMFFEVTGECW